MKDKVKKILDDLYKLDPSLEQHDDKLQEYVLMLEKMKPDTEFTQEFEQRLKKQLLNKIQFQKSNTVEKKTKYTLYFITKRFFSWAFFSLMMLFGIFSVLNLEIIQQKDSEVQFNKSYSDKSNDISLSSTLTDWDSISDEERKSNELDMIALDIEESKEFENITNEKITTKMQSQTEQLWNKEIAKQQAPDNATDLSQTSPESLEWTISSRSLDDADELVESSPQLFASDMSLQDSSLADDSEPTMKMWLWWGYDGFPWEQNWGFAYDWDLWDLYNKAVKLNSYKIQWNEWINYNIDNMFQNISFTWLNLWNIDDSKIRSMSYRIKINESYDVSVNFESWEINISNLEMANRYTDNSFGINSKVDSNSIEKIAREFVNKFGINLSDYWTGGLLDVWSYWNIRAFTYPLILGGIGVYESWWETYWIKLEIDRIKWSVIRAFNINFKEITKISNNNFVELSQITKDLKNDNDNSVKLSNPRVIYTKVYVEGVVYFVPGIIFDYKDAYTWNMTSYVLPINNIKN